jgi:hypothetical protein
VSANGRHNADELLATAIAAGLTFGEAAKRAGVSERTARRRMKDDEFRGQVSEARSAMVSQGVGRVSSLLVDAAETLGELMRSAESESVRLGAARGLLQFAAQRRGAPVGDGLLRLTTITPGDHAEVVGGSSVISRCR